MSDVDNAWLAGIVDGEGCIYIARRKPYGSLRSFTYALGIKVTMGHELTIARVHEIAGVGSRHRVQNPVGPRGRANPAFTWLATSHKALAVIQQIRPYLITKAVEADIAQRFMTIPPTPFRNGNVADPDLLSQKLALWDAMRRAKPTFEFKEAHKEVTHA